MEKFLDELILSERKKRKEKVLDKQIDLERDLPEQYLQTVVMSDKATSIKIPAFMKDLPEKLVEQMEELVWEVIIRPDQLSELEQVLVVSNVNIAKEGLLVRVIAESEQMKEQQIQFGWGTP